MPGVGLSTKAGTARFIRSIAGRLGAELRPMAPSLLKPLLAALPGEGSGAVRRAYASAAACLAVRCAGDKRQARFVADALGWYGAVPVALPRWPGDGAGDGASAAAAADVDEPDRNEARAAAGGLLLRELLRESGDAFAAHASQVRAARAELAARVLHMLRCAHMSCSNGALCPSAAYSCLPVTCRSTHAAPPPQILPVAFLASHDGVAAVAAAWAPVWSEGCPSEPAALRLHAAELASLLGGGFSSNSWERKKAAGQVSRPAAGVGGPPPTWRRPYTA